MSSKEQIAKMLPIEPRRRLGGRLLSALAARHPLLWRTQFLPAIAVSLAAGAVLFRIGRSWQIEVATVPTIADVAALPASLWWPIGMGLAAWIFLQVRAGIGEWSAHRLLAAGALYAVVIFSALASPLFLIVPLFKQIASALPEAEVARDYETHAPFGFWACDARLAQGLELVELDNRRTTGLVEANADAIRAALARYGGVAPTDMRIEFGPYFLFEGTYVHSPCPDPELPFIATKDAKSASPFLLRHPIESIRAAHDFAHGAGRYHELVIGRIPILSGISLLISTCLILAAFPRSVWGRRFGHHMETRWLPALVPRLPALLLRLDTRLATTCPILWSTRLLPSLYVAGAYVAILAWVAIGVAHWPGLMDLIQIGADEGRLHLIVVVVGATLFITLGVRLRGFSLAGQSTRGDLAAILLYTLLLLPFLALVVGATMSLTPNPYRPVQHLADDTDYGAMFSGIGLSIVGLYVVLTIYTSRYVRSSVVASGLVASIILVVAAAWVGTWLTTGNDGAALQLPALGVWVLLIIAGILRVRRPIIAQALAASAVLSVPIVTSVVTVADFGLFDSDRETLDLAMRGVVLGIVLTLLSVSLMSAPLRRAYHQPSPD